MKKDIGLIGGPREIYTAQERLRGYCNAHKKRSIPVQESLVYHGDYTMQGGVRALKDLVKRNPHMTAVFVVNYEMTMGAVIGVNELGIKIPRELSLVGFDNREFARACSPRLTIVTQPTQQIARRAAEIMLERLDAGNGVEERNYITEKLQTEIELGKSVRDIREI